MNRINPLTKTETPVTFSKYSKDEWRLVVCQETGLLYLENPPETSKLVDEFAWERTYAEEKKKRKEREPLFSFVSGRVEAVKRLLNRRKRIVSLSINILKGQHRRHGSTLRMLDVGCGDGGKSISVLEQVRDRDGFDLEPWGLEISDGLFPIAQRAFKAYGGDVVQGPALEAIEKVPDASMDLILICSYLEHELDPVELLERSGEKLREGGSVLIKVPNLNSLNRIIRQKRWCGFRYPDHVNYFTPATLRIAVERSGLAVAQQNFSDRIPTNDNQYIIARNRTTP